jgi:hypothetical protein
LRLRLKKIIFFVLPIVASCITGTPVEFVQVLPQHLRQSAETPMAT